MKESPVDPGSALEPASPSLGRQAMHGAFWNVLFSILNKVTTFGGQIVLAWFLLPSDLGLIGLATSVTSMMSIISVGSLGDIIVQERDDEKFRKDFGEVFWLCNSINLATAVLAIAVTPWVGRAYQQPQLVPLILLFILNGQFVGFSLIHGAALKRSLRFKSMAVIFFISGTIQSLASIFMAWRGYGPYAIIVPLALSSLIGLICQVYAVGKVSLGRPHPHLWPAYLRPSFWLLFMTILPALQGQGTSFVMGFSQSTTQIGLYFWGFSLANQVIFLICGNLRNVLFPTLARLNDDPLRQAEALKKSTGIMMTVLAFLCVLQAVTAAPLIALIFPERWRSASAVVSWISLGMLTQPFSMLCYSILMAKAQYRLVVINAAVQGALVLTCATIGCLMPNSNATCAASWTALGFFLGGIYSGWQMFEPLGRPWRQLAGLMAKPLSIAAGCGLCGYLAAQSVSEHGFLWQLSLGFTGVSVAYAAAIRLFDMQTYRQLRGAI